MLVWYKELINPLVNNVSDVTQPIDFLKRERVLSLILLDFRQLKKGNIWANIYIRKID